MRTVLSLIVALVWSLPAKAEEAEPRCVVPSASEIDPPREEVTGHYMAVSESEWGLEVWLRSDGTAEVLSEGWGAGRHAERTADRYRGSWSLTGTHVELRYRRRCETLRFDPELSFAEFGAKGAAPGLRGEHSSSSEDLFLRVSLWSAESLRPRRDPVEQLRESWGTRRLSKSAQAHLAAAAGGGLPHTQRQRASFEKLTGSYSPLEVFLKVGVPDADVGSGVHIFRYALSDGSFAEVWAPGLDVPATIRLFAADGEVRVIFQPSER